MLKVAKEQKGAALVVRLSGSIEETANFETQIGAPTGEVQVSTKEISRINSIGVKAWIKYFQGLHSRGVQLKFLECSTVIVEQINQISNFTCGGEVESIFVPFACAACKTELLGLYKCADLKKMNMKLPEHKCSKCGGKVVFDDIPEEYLGFLNR